MDLTSGRQVISSVFSAATQPSSAPPKLEMCANPSSVSQPAHWSLTRTAAIGYMPPDSPLPVTGIGQREAVGGRDRLHDDGSDVARIECRGHGCQVIEPNVNELLRPVG